MKIPLTQLCVFGPHRGPCVHENVFLLLLRPSFFFPRRSSFDITHNFYLTNTCFNGP